MGRLQKFCQPGVLIGRETDRSTGVKISASLEAAGNHNLNIAVECRCSVILGEVCSDSYPMAAGIWPRLRQVRRKQVDARGDAFESFADAVGDLTAPGAWQCTKSKQPVCLMEELKAYLRGLEHIGLDSYEFLEAALCVACE